MRRLLPSLLIVPLLFGCRDMMADGDGRALGDELGFFRVDAELESSTCGKGALGSPAEWQFDIVLSREGEELFWDTGAEFVTGRLDGEGRFSLASETRVPVDAAGPAQEPCTVVRGDAASGVLEEAAEGVAGFNGTLTYSFAEADETDCSPLLLAPGGFERLPCSMRYAMRATRTER